MPPAPSGATISKESSRVPAASGIRGLDYTLSHCPASAVLGRPVDGIASVVEQLNERVRELEQRVSAREGLKTPPFSQNMGKGWGTLPFSPSLSQLFVRFGWIAQQTVHRRRFGGAQVDVVFGGVLKSDKERLRAAQCVFAEQVPVLELELISELADERPVLAASAPDGNIGLATEAVAEVEQADILQDLLDNGVADEVDLFLGVLSDFGKDREYVDQGVHVADILAAHANGRAIELHV